MLKVKFNIQSSDMSEIECVEGEFTDKETEVLRCFIMYADRTSESRLLKNGLPMLKRMTFPNGEFRIECEEYSNCDLYELLHLLRPLILDEEKASFEKVRVLIANKLKHQTIRSKIKEIKREFDNGIIAGFMQIKVNDVDLFCDRTFKLWLNGMQYHTDEEKREAWMKIENVLEGSNSRAYLITQIHSKINAIEKLYFLTKLILAPNDPDNKLSLTLP